MITKGWSGLDSIPDKVFIEREFTPIGDMYEYSNTEPGGWSIDDILDGGHARHNFINLFYCLPEIFAPVNEIASRVADATWLLKKNMDDSVDWNDKNFNRLFTKPNPLMGMKEFVWQSVVYELVTGAVFQMFNTPSVLSSDYKNILTWSNLPTPDVCINKKKGVDRYTATDISDFVLNYSVPQEGSTRVFDVNQIMPILHLDVKYGNDIDRFVSPLMGAKLAIKNLLPVYEARGVIYIKRGALGFLVSKKSDDSGLVSLTPKEKEEAQQQYQNTYGLNRGKNQVGVISAPLEYIQTSMSIQELQPFDETLADAIAIYKSLRVPRSLVPSKDQSTFSNTDSDMRSFYYDVIIPLAKKYAEKWTDKLAIPNRYIEANYDHLDLLQENKKDKASSDQINGNIWLQRWQNGTCTLNNWIASWDGEKGIGKIYENKIFDLTSDEITLIKTALNLKTVSTNANNTPQDPGTSQEITTNKL